MQGNTRFSLRTLLSCSILLQRLYSMAPEVIYKASSRWILFTPHSHPKPGPGKDSCRSAWRAFRLSLPPVASRCHPPPGEGPSSFGSTHQGSIWTSCPCTGWRLQSLVSRLFHLGTSTCRGCGHPPTKKTTKTNYKIGKTPRSTRHYLKGSTRTDSFKHHDNLMRQDC